MSHGNHKESLHYLRNLIILFLFISCILFVGGVFRHDEVKAIEPFSQEIISIDIEGTIFTLETSSLIKTKLINQGSKTNEGFFKDFFSWLGFIGGRKTNLIHEQYLLREISLWEQGLNLEKPSEGSFAIENGELIIEPPQKGESIDIDQLSNTLERFAKTPEKKRSYTIVSYIVEQEPKTSEREFEELADNLTLFLSRDFRLSHEQLEIQHVLSQEELPYLVSFSFDEDTDSHNVTLRTSYLEEQLQNYNREVQDAGFSIEETSVVITPSHAGIVVNIQETEQNITEAIDNQTDHAELVFSITEPEFTTKEAEDLNIDHLVSSFTTYYSCCEARARNIQSVAKLVDGVLILPDETFNLNTFIGRRTIERGFEPAGTIVKGSMIETVGGGISQFATTFYNTIFWGGYQDISHTPHSRYFSRYPEGIEATISWPEPHLIFKNNTPHGILIKTKTSDTSVTVQFFSNNDGRTLSGKHKDGKTTITILNEGGDNARIVESTVSERTDIYDPKEIYYVDPLVETNAIFTKTQGRPSYSVDVVRTVTQADVVVSQRTWKVFYLSEDKEFIVNSCEFVPSGGICKTKEDMEQEKKELEDFFQQLEDSM